MRKFTKLKIKKIVHINIYNININIINIYNDIIL